MSKTLKWLLMLLIWLVFCFIGFHACVKDECLNCQKTETVAETPPPVEEQRYPIDFQWNDAQAYTNNGYDAMRSRLISEMGDGNSLVITGKYFSSETAPAGFENMGLARAAKIRDLLAPDIPADRIRLKAQLMDDLSSARKGYFESTDFEWETKEDQKVEVIELENSIKILYPHGSAQKEDDGTIDAYLTKLAARLAQTNETVQITGYTDDTGGASGNMNLSKKRARGIRDILIRLGVDKARLKVDWKGEGDPELPNTTEANRHQNRRVVLQMSGGN